MVKNNPFFSKRLISWYLNNKRTLPWRDETNPYFIWLSEIILQQTRVEQGLPYYLKFVSHFPTIFELANASEETVLKLWQGLGYYSRARNLHSTAKYIALNCNGVFPNTYNELIKLKGIGDYTASAIASICFNAATAVVDGNVYRVLSRVFGVNTPINSTKGIKEFKKLAQLLIDPKQPGTYNQAVMEFGARHCTPQNPDCNACIFSGKCDALKTKRLRSLPVKLKKKQIRKRYFNYLVVIAEEHEKTILKQRSGKGIWQKLYEFPLIETSSEVNKATLITLPKYIKFSEKLEIQHLSLFNENPVVHKLSHQHLHTRFWILKTKEKIKEMIPFSEVDSYPVPVLIENFISDFKAIKN